MKSIIPIVVSLLTLSVTFITSATEYKFEFKDGVELTGIPQSISGESLTVLSDNQSKTFLLTDLTSITVASNTGASQRMKNQVALSDGSVIRVKDIEFSNGKTVLDFGDVQLKAPESQIVSVRFNDNSELDKSWNELAKIESQQDLLIVEKEGKLRYHRGHVEGLTAEKVPFSLDGSTMPVSRAKVFGIRLVRAFSAASGAELAVGKTSAGSEWSIGSIEVNGNDLVAVSRLGHKIPVGSGVNDIHAIIFSQDPEFYLSDMTMESWSWSPFVTASGIPNETLAQFNQPRLNQGFSGLELKTNDQKFTKGICVRSKTDMTFRLSQNFSRLTATVGIADVVRPKGSVDLEIYADGESVYKTAVSGAESAKTIDVPITNAKRIRIVVDFGSEASIGDVLIIGAARLWE